MFNTSNHLDNIVREQGEEVQFHLAVLTTSDSTDNDYGEKVETLLQPISVRCLVSNTNPEKLRWKFQGIETNTGFDFLIPISYLGTVRLSYKITIRGVDCYGYKNNTDRIAIQQLDSDYLKVSTTRIE